MPGAGALSFDPRVGQRVRTAVYGRGTTDQTHSRTTKERCGSPMITEGVSENSIHVL